MDWNKSKIRMKIKQVVCDGAKTEIEYRAALVFLMNAINVENYVGDRNFLPSSLIRLDFDLNFLTITKCSGFNS